jgi:hypothetical protein
VHSERLKRFLRYRVEEALAGRPENLKEYNLALEVFDKDASHDPGSDPIVRVEARRLRTRLVPPSAHPPTHSHSSAQPSAMAMNRTDQVQFVRHRCQLPADG